MDVFEKTRELFSIIQPNELVLEMFTFIEKYYGDNKIENATNNFRQNICRTKKER